MTFSTRVLEARLDEEDDPAEETLALLRRLA